jgi:hypothetical protein
MKVRTILTPQGSQKALLVMEKMHLEIANDQKKDTSERTLTLIHFYLSDGDLYGVCSGKIVARL